jgi:uncharacterized membrane protein YsdA (DUF1294 family)
LNDAWTLLFCWLVAVGLAGFALMGFDKRRARTGGRRLPERTFYELALIGGALGIVAGAFVFHHKTSKALFFGVIVILAICWIALLNGLQTPLGPPFG